DLAAELAAAEASASGAKFKLSEAQETERQNRGETGSATQAAEAQLKAAQATLAQAQATLAHQKADTSRTVALADQGIMSAQSKDEAVTSLQADEAAVSTAQGNVAAAQASLQQARAHELLTNVSAHTVSEMRDTLKNAQAQADQARVEQGYANVYAPVDGRV